MNFSGGGIQSPPSGNRKRCGCLFIMRMSIEKCGVQNVQLQEGEIGVAVVRLRLALLHDVVLEDARRLGVVPIEAIKDLVNVLWPFRREIEGGAHGELCGCATVGGWCCSSRISSAAIM
jgi:hypothetical protein